MVPEHVSKLLQGNQAVAVFVSDFNQFIDHLLIYLEGLAIFLHYFLNLVKQLSNFTSVKLLVSILIVQLE